MSNIKDELAAFLRAQYVQFHSTHARALARLNDEAMDIFTSYDERLPTLTNAFDKFIQKVLKAEGISEVEFSLAKQARADLAYTLSYLDQLEDDGH